MSHGGQAGRFFHDDDVGVQVPHFNIADLGQNDAYGHTAPARGPWTAMSPWLAALPASMLLWMYDIAE